MALRNDQNERDRTAGLRDETAQPAARERVVESQHGWNRLRRDGLLRRHPYIAAIVAIVLIAAIGYGIVWYLNPLHYVSTDDAFIDTRNVQISSQVTGAITAVPVTDNQSVEKGALLVHIDPRDYQAAEKQAKAGSNRRTLHGDQARRRRSAAVELAVAQASATQQRAGHARKRHGSRFERAQRLLKSEAASTQRLDDLQTAGRN